jgi:hypothetical protein
MKINPNKQVESAKLRLKLVVLKELAPDLFDACEAAVEPLIKDYNHLKFIHEKFEAMEGFIVCENMHFFLAVLYRLYIPAQLFSTVCKKPIGMRDEFAKLLGYDNPENINSWEHIMKAYYKGVRFAEKVDQVSFAILKMICDELEETPATHLSKAVDLASVKPMVGNLKMVHAVVQLIEGQNKHITGADASLLF